MNSLFMSMPHVAQVEKILDFNVQTPKYNKNVTYSEASVHKETDDEVSQLERECVCVCGKNRHNAVSNFLLLLLLHFSQFLIAIEEMMEFVGGISDGAWAENGGEREKLVFIAIEERENVSISFTSKNANENCLLLLLLDGRLLLLVGLAKSYY